MSESFQVAPFPTSSMQHSTQPDLPTEIQTHIISLVYSDSSSTALTCALVCREWLFISRTLSFSRPIQIFKPRPRIGDDELVDLLEHHLSTLRLFLTRISLRLKSARGNMEMILEALTEYGPPVQELSVSRLVTGSDPLGEEQLIRFIKHNASLQVLELDSVSSSASRVPQLLEAISGCALLTDLSFHISGAQKELDTVNTSISLPPPSLVRLTTSLVTPAFVEKWVFGASHVENIQLDLMELNLSRLTRILCQSRIDRLPDHGSFGLKVNSGDALDNFLSSPQCASKVNSLAIDCGGNLQDKIVNLNFSLAENLHDLKLRFSIWCGEGNETVLSSITHSLSTTPAHTQIDIHILIRIYILGIGPYRQQKVQLDIALNSFVERMSHARFVRVRIQDDRRRESSIGSFPLCEVRSTIARNFLLDTRAPHEWDIEG